MREKEKSEREREELKTALGEFREANARLEKKVKE